MKTMPVVFLLAVLANVGLISMSDAQKPGAASQPGPGVATIYTSWPFDVAGAVKRQDETAKALGVDKSATLALGKQATMKLALIPAGKFTMGSPKDEKGRSANEGPQHEVIITHAFYMGVYPVTQQEYEQLAGTNPSQFKSGRNPVEMMSWDDAVAFCAAASKKTGKVVRLPTEAEWEYACRAGTDSAYFFGDDAGKLEQYAWVKSNSGGKTHLIGLEKPNAWGLYDMYGNVWQWCADWIGADFYGKSPKEDPQGPATGIFRVLRGGSWASDPAYCRSASRLQNLPPHKVGKIGSFGFRVVVEIGKK